MRKIEFNIIRKELAKIFDIRFIILLTVTAAVFFMLFMKYYTELDNAHSQSEECQLALKMVKAYGTQMDRQEFEDFKTWRAGLEAECQRQITGNPVFEQAGIYSYSDYMNLYENEYSSGEEISSAQHEAIWALLGKECGYAQFFVQAYDNIYSDYEAALPNTPGENFTDILPYEVFDYADSYITWLAVLCVLSVMFLTAPLAVNERITGVITLQKASRQGRNTVKTQIIAVAVSALIVTAAEAVLGLVIFFSSTKAAPFLNSRLSSFLVHSSQFGSLTFLQYILGSLALIFIFSVSAALITYVLSAMSRNMISVLLKTIPAFVLLSYAAKKPLLGHGIIAERLMLSNQTNLVPVICAVFFFVLAVAACAFSVKRELKTEE